MKLRKNNKGSSLVITLVLMALVSTLLVGAHTAVIALSTRINSTYYENQAYLSARSVVTAVAEEISNISQTELENIKSDENVEVETSNELIKKLNSMQDGEKFTINDFKFSDDKFLDGDISATIEKTTVEDKIVYKIFATADVNGKTEKVGVELATTENTITRGEVGQGDVVETGSGTLTFYHDDDHTYFSGDATFHNVESLIKEYSEKPMMVSTGNVTLSGKTKFEEEVEIYAKTITFDLTSGESLDLLAEFYAKEIKIYAKSSNDKTIYDLLQLKKESKMYVNKVSVYIDGSLTSTYTTNDTVDEVKDDGDSSNKVRGVSSDYTTIMGKATSQTVSSGLPSDFPKTKSEKDSNSYSYTIESINRNRTLNSVNFANATQNNPKYFFVESGVTCTVKNLQNEYVHIYLEDGAKLIIDDHDQNSISPIFSLYLGGDNCNIEWKLYDKTIATLTNISGGEGSTGGSVSSNGITYNCATLTGSDSIVFYRGYEDLNLGHIQKPTMQNIYCWQGMHLAKTTGRYDNKNIYCKGEFLLTLGDSGSTITNTNIYADKIVLDYLDYNNQNGNRFVFNNSKIYAKEIEIRSPQPRNNVDWSNSDWFQLNNNSNIYTDKLTISITGQNTEEYTAGQSFPANKTNYTVNALPNDYQQKVGFPSESASWPSNYPTTIADLTNSGLQYAELRNINSQDLKSDTIYYLNWSSNFNFNNLNATKENPIYIIIKNGATIQAEGLSNEYCYVFLEDNATLYFTNMNNGKIPKATVFSDPDSTVTVKISGNKYSGTGESDGSGGVVMPPVEVTKEYNYTTYELSKYIRG